MNRRKILETGIDCLRHPTVYFSRKKYIFLISHMRSYSSLIGHILGSHPEIDGYAENHQSYRNYLDFLKLKRKVRLTNDSINGDYVFDKLLHNSNTFSDWALSRKNIKIIIAIRKPERTIKSLVHLFCERKDSRSKCVSDYVDYYQKRLTEINRLIKRIQGAYYFLEAEKIISDTQKTLLDLAEYLALSSPLKKEYNLFKFTGQPGIGDSSEFIKKGSVERVRNSYEGIKLSKQVLAPAVKIYSEILNAVNLTKDKVFVSSHN
ncbi:MAG: hypothetical protein ACREVY_09755 [Gammaproteobacteria bacterium]